MSFRRINKVICSAKWDKFECRDSEKWLGFTLELEDESSVKVLVEDFHSCCEVFGVVLLGFQPQELVGQILESVCIVQKVPDLFYEIEDPNQEPLGEQQTLTWKHPLTCISTCVVELQLGPENQPMVATLVAYNCHDGYYKHNLCLQWGDFQEIQEL